MSVLKSMALKLLPMSEVDVKCLPLYLPTFPFFGEGFLLNPDFTACLD